jgi:hypothetical protein
VIKLGKKKIFPEERIGIIFYNKYGSKMIVDKYIDSQNVWIRFIDTNEKIHTNWDNFKKGKIRSYYDKSLCGVGYIGKGEYKGMINYKFTIQYKYWYGLIKRCYDKKMLDKYQTYTDCEVCDEWHCFQNFAKWFDENYYEIEGQRMELDKDILIKGNKFYSPETCVFVPRFINTLFLKKDANRGDCPIGVFKVKERINTYSAKVSRGRNKSVHLGYFKTPEEAFHAYKKYKESLIKEVADNYKDKIPLKLYNAMLAYEVEITD